MDNIYFRELFDHPSYAGALLKLNYFVCKALDIFISRLPPVLFLHKHMWCWELHCQPVNKDGAQIVSQRQYRGSLVFLQWCRCYR